MKHTKESEVNPSKVQEFAPKCFRYCEPYVCGINEKHTNQRSLEADFRDDLEAGIQYVHPAFRKVWNVLLTVFLGIGRLLRKEDKGSQ